jgi:midasin (ATPase involved in ribosome maturation)
MDILFYDFCKDYIKISWYYKFVMLLWINVHDVKILIYMYCAYIVIFICQLVGSLTFLHPSMLKSVK